MKYPHFFKAYCRLGLTSVPFRMEELNIGVEDAPNKILSEEFLKKFPNSKVSEFTFSTPEEASLKNYWQILIAELEQFKNLINENLNRERQIVVGGDNSITFSSLLAVLERIKDPKKVGYIQFDSHGEANSFKSSLSKNFHGMYIRPFLEEFDILEINCLVPNKIPAENFLTIGNLDLDPDEKDLYQRLNIKNFNKSNLDQADDFIIKNFIHQFEHIHINFDVDVFDKSVAPATGIPTENGLLPDQLFPLLAIIKTHPSWSFDLAEVNPKKIGSGKTIKLAQQILEFILK